MAEEVFVATFAHFNEAEAARRDLEAAGFPSGKISTRAQDSGNVQSHETGFWDWLLGREPDYRTHIEGGAALLTVRADGAQYERIAEILQGHPLTETEATGGQDRRPYGASPQSGIAPSGLSSAAASGEETVIPTAREELQVGKREVEDARQYRIRRYTVERPVEEQVELRSETVEIERRAPGATGVASGQPFEDKIVEVTERREEPVVSKQMRPGEDVVVRKSEDRRTETVRDTVRESKVDVDRAAAGDKPSKT
jgi:hypothetical protein